MATSKVLESRGFPDQVKIEAPLPAGWEVSAPVEFARLVLNTSGKKQSVVHIDLPPVWQHSWKRDQVSFHGFFIWEGLGIPECFTEIMIKGKIDGRLTGVLCPSRHVMSQVRRNVDLVPHGVNHDLFKPGVLGKEWDEIRMALKDRFVFGFVGGWAQGATDRKDLLSALKAYCEEFKKEDDVAFLVRVNKVYNPGMNVREELEKEGVPMDGPKIIIMNDDPIPYCHMPGLYRCMDCYVCPSVEGFGLTFLEAMSCGIPCIATGLGGQTDFVNNDNGWLVDYEMIPATDRNPMYENTLWPKVKIPELRKSLREAYDGGAKAKSMKAYLDSKAYSWEFSAIKLLEVIGYEPEEISNERREHEQVR